MSWSLKNLYRRWLARLAVFKIAHLTSSSLNDEKRRQFIYPNSKLVVALKAKGWSFTVEQHKEKSAMGIRPANADYAYPIEHAHQMTDFLKDFSDAYYESLADDVAEKKEVA